MIMNRDRREYSRLRLEDTPADVFVNKTNKEMTVTVHDISENGISFEFPKEYRNDIHVHDEIRFQFVAEYYFGDNFESDIVMEKASIRHINETDDYLLVGCSVRSLKYNEFVTHRQIAHEVEIRLSNIQKNRRRKIL